METQPADSETYDIVRAGVEELLDYETLVVALSPNPDGSEALELQMALSGFDEQDVGLGMDTYCLVLPSGATFYGGVRACIREGSSLGLYLTDAAAEALGVPPLLRLRLLIDEERQAEVAAGLRRVLTCGRDVPEPLIL
ncbi:MAG: Imm10 family immunity protein [Chloroflexota bacterium]|nr:Imm10 family immunity protein [Chloroflexota bacterium]